MSLIAYCLALSLPVSGCAQEVSRGEIVDQVWTTVNDNYFDPSFGGLNWRETGERYRALAIAAVTDSAFYVRLNEMLFQLGVSHIGVIPRSHPEWIGAPSAFADGGIGAEARIVDGKMVLTIVRPGSPADSAGLGPGVVIDRIGGRTLDDLTEEALAMPRPPLDERALITQKVLENLYGPSATGVTLEVTDGEGKRQEVTVIRTQRPGRTAFMKGIPPVFLEFESRRVGGDIAYLRFNSFHPDLVDPIVDAIDNAAGAAGLIIDLRGNAGGAFGVRRAIAERLVGERTVFWRYRRRSGTDDIVLTPASRVYRGPVAVLTDCTSASSSEELAGSLQAIGRAVVVGERTPGIVLVADIVELRSGDTLVYPSAQTLMPDGRVLEGRGVVPDIEAFPTVASLLAGRDVVMDAAVRYIKSIADSPTPPEN